MEKYYTLDVTGCSIRNSLEEATNEAKREAADGRSDILIFKAIAIAKCPVPNIEVVTF